MKKLSISQSAIIGEGLAGLIWIVLGFLNIIEIAKPIKQLLAIPFLLGGILIVLSFFLKSDKDDELAKRNKDSASLIVFSLMFIGFVVVSMVSLFKSTWNIDLVTFMPFLLGGILLLRTILIVVFERVGGIPWEG